MIYNYDNEEDNTEHNLDSDGETQDIDANEYHQVKYTEKSFHRQIAAADVRRHGQDIYRAEAGHRSVQGVLRLDHALRSQEI